MCSFRFPFGGHIVLEWTHAKEEDARDELNNGHAQMGVIFLVYVQHELGQDSFLVFSGGFQWFVAPSLSL